MVWLLAWVGTAGALAGCIAVEGERLLAADLAAAEPVFAALPPDTVLGWAPAPGARRLLGTRELERLAARHGLKLAAARAVCVERALAPLSGERVLEALRRALGREDARIELVDYSRRPVPRGELEFDRAQLAQPSGGAAVWRGRLRCDGGRSLPVWARVRIVAPGRRVVALENLAPGRPVQPSQVGLDEGEWFPFGEPPLTRVEEAVGRLPRRWIPAGAVLYARLLTAPREVERGEEVLVEVASGGAQLRFRARAETGGRSGDVILVRNPANGRRIAARVEGPGKAVIHASAVERGVGDGVFGGGR
ncbi:MAG: flagellar basal body P-ring formation chaperone FlgA [Bryobacterales bacterium]|nr:flagellar basal body P-ring formation chaperone FlgA [Bryobacterales bacterium]